MLDDVFQGVNEEYGIKRVPRTFEILLFVMLLKVSDFARTKEFTLKGSLQSSSVSANGNFDLEFILFDLLTGGDSFATLAPRPALGNSPSAIQNLNAAIAASLIYERFP